MAQICVDNDANLCHNIFDLNMCHLRRMRMNSSAVELKKYMEESLRNYDKENERSLWEFFGSYYRMYNPILTDELRERFQPAELILNSLSRKRERRLFYITREVCEGYACAAFIDGIRTGAQLIMELLESE